jgi:hypothetical protein
LQFRFATCVGKHTYKRLLPIFILKRSGSETSKDSLLRDWMKPNLRRDGDEKQAYGDYGPDHRPILSSLLAPHRDPLQLETAVQEQWSRSQKRPSRQVALAEVRSVSLIKTIEQREVRTVNLDINQIIHRHLSGFQHIANAIKQQRDLLVDIGWRSTDRWIDSDTTREVQSIPDQDSVAKGQVVTAIGQIDEAAFTRQGSFSSMTN